MKNVFQLKMMKYVTVHVKTLIILESCLSRFIRHIIPNVFPNKNRLKIAPFFNLYDLSFFRKNSNFCRFLCFCWFGLLHQQKNWIFVFKINTFNQLFNSIYSFIKQIKSIWNIKKNKTKQNNQLESINIKQFINETIK